LQTTNEFNLMRADVVLSYSVSRPNYYNRRRKQKVHKNIRKTHDQMTDKVKCRLFEDRNWKHGSRRKANKSKFLSGHKTIKLCGKVYSMCNCLGS